MYFADNLSRAHTTNIEPNNLYDAEISVASIYINTSMIDLINTATENDITLQEVIQHARTGWPINNKAFLDEVKPFFTYRDEITVDDKIILKGNQIRIPKELWANILEKLHESHLGIINYKQLGRDSVFWPGMNSQIEDKITRYQISQQFRSKLSKEPLISHNITDIPFYKTKITY